MKKFLKQISLFALPVMAGVMCLFCLNPDKQFSYRFVEGECSNKASWIYDRVFLSDKDVDVVFIGASQTATAVKDELIENRLGELTGQALKVASLGYCRGGRDIQYVMLKEVFRNKKPKMVIIEVSEDEPKKSHPVFPYLAETEDLFESAVFFNQRFFLSLWKGVVIRFEYLKEQLFGGDGYHVGAVADYGYIPTEAVAEQAVLQRNRMNWEGRLSSNKSAVIRKMELRYSMHYLEKMVKMAESNGGRVMFLYLRESGSGLREPMLADYYMSFSEIVVLPEDIYTDPGNWFDATHLNDKGATLASEVIAGDLARMFRDYKTAGGE
jgi:hypothetical protein